MEEETGGEPKEVANGHSPDKYAQSEGHQHIPDIANLNDEESEETRQCCHSRCSFFQDFTSHHFVTFFLTFFSYCLYHASRKTLSNVKGTLRQEWMASTHGYIEPNNTWEQESHELFKTTAGAEDFLGALDAIFMGAYAIGLYISGWVGDRIDPRYVLTFGMVGSAVSLFLFGTLTEWLQFYSIPFYVITWIVFGLTQACGWPAEVAIMSHWFGKGRRGLILGIWASCQSVGNIFGAWIVAEVLKYGYEYAFLINASLMIFGAVIVFFGLVTHPEEMDLLPEGEKPSDRRLSNESLTVPPPISFLQALLLPGVLIYCVCNACLKLTNYAFFFWLPYYLDKKFHWDQSTADKISIWYDVGAAIGSIIGGYISDLIKCRSPVIVTMLLISLGSLYGYSEIEKSRSLNEALMTLVGAVVGGPYNLIAATVAADLGTQPGLAGNAAALSTVTGLIDGTGSVGSALGQIVVPVIEQTNETTGWQYVFYLFMVMNTLAMVSLIPRLIHDGKRFRVWYRGEDESTPILDHETSPS